MARKSIYTDTFAHANPIPVATRIGPLVESSVIVGYNPGTRDMPESDATQLANLFIHMEAALTGAGASWDDVIKVDFYTNDADARARINPYWIERFPDADSLPSRHTHMNPDGGPPRISCAFRAWVES